jgi:hypothetical protein
VNRILVLITCTHFPMSWKVLVIFSLGSSPDASASAALGPMPGTCVVVEEVELDDKTMVIGRQEWWRRSVLLVVVVEEEA